MALVMLGSVCPVNAAGTGTADAVLSVRANTGIPPDTVGALTGTPSTVEGQVLLSWTAPNVAAGTALDSYEVRIQTYPVTTPAALSTWWDSSTGSLIQGFYGESPGAAVSRTFGPAGSDHSVSLFPGS